MYFRYSDSGRLGQPETFINTDQIVSIKADYGRGYELRMSNGDVHNVGNNFGPIFRELTIGK
jgi:hypothetical protein